MSVLNIILLSGGSGLRLWPLSNESRSKQFLKLLKDERGNYESMLQRVYRQITTSGISDQVIVATSQSQTDIIKSQLSCADIVLEPERRNTYPAILLSCAYLYYEKGAQPDETVIVMPVDPFAEQDFFERIKKLGSDVSDGSVKLALMGACPTYPSEKYGYILPTDKRCGNDSVYVSSFCEKPDVEKAEQLISQGALWNCGVFAFRLGFALELAERSFHSDSYEDFREQYHKLDKTSFDYAVVEKTSPISVVKYQGEWSDLGTWNTLTEKMDVTCKGQAVLNGASENTHVINELGIPVLVMGARNMVVVASHDGILVADKGQSSYIKPYAEQLAGRPMYEERRWGEYSVLDHTELTKTRKSLTKRLHLRAGKSISYQLHRHRQEVWTIIEGQGQVILDDDRRIVKPGDVVLIPVGVKHSVTALCDLQFIEVQIGDSLVETDIERF